jgi:5-methylcytosine-specific restriction endonuclease McrA
MIALLDDTKYFLGLLCKRSHDFQGTGLSQRYKKNQVCVECAVMRSRSQVQQAQQARTYYSRTEGGAARREAQAAGVKFYLGTLCVKGHDAGQGKSRRYTKSDMCVECCQERNQKNDPIYYRNNRERLLQQDREYRATERGKEVHRHAASNYAAWHRAQLEKIHFVPFTDAEFEQRCRDFGNVCAYCGCRPEKLTQDHFLPVAYGGPHCLGNIVPACGSCNSSKNDSDPLEWYRRKAFYKEERWAKIVRILGKSHIDYRQLPLF